MPTVKVINIAPPCLKSLELRWGPEWSKEVEKLRSYKYAQVVEAEPWK